MSTSDNVDQDQTARSVQSDLDLHCPQKVSQAQQLTGETSVFSCH